MKCLAPVILFVYNRPEHTKKTLDYLKQNELAQDTELFIFSDAAKSIENEDDVLKVRKIISKVDGFKKVTIIEAQENKGLANSIIEGVTEIIGKYKKVIVLEDDMLTSSKFLNFMNDSLNFYKNKEEIWSISGYNFPVKIPSYYNKSIYFAYRSSSWGWATWEDRWLEIDWNISDYKSYRFNPFKIYHFCKGGNNLDKMIRYQMKNKIDSWAVRWCYNQAFKNKYTLYPVKSLVTNIGTDNSGTHCDETASRFYVDIDNDFVYKFENDIVLDRKILKNFKKLLDKSVLRRIKNIYFNILR